MKINNPPASNVIATTNPLAIDIGDAAIPGVLGEVSDSGHQHAALATQFLRQAGEQLTEGTTTSTSAVDLVSLTGLAIPVATPFFIFYSWRKTTGAANQVALGLTLNSTVVDEATIATGSLYLGGVANAAESGAGCIYVAPRTALYLRAAGRFHGGVTATDGFWTIGTADFPAVDITAVTIRGIVANVAITLGVDDLRVALLPTT